jgi:hypothetical protein
VTGKFNGRAIKWELATATTGTEYILVKFCLDDGTYVYWRGFMTDKTWARTVEALKYCGWDGADFGSLFNEEADNGMGTSDVELVLEEEEYEGKTVTKVKWVNALGGAPMKVQGAMSGEERRRFIAKMQARLGSTGKVPPTKPTTRPAPDDDIPF